MVRLFVGDWDKNRANQSDPMAGLCLLTGGKDCGAVKFHNSGLCRGVVACCLPWETKTLLNAKSENLKRKKRNPRPLCGLHNSNLARWIAPVSNICVKNKGASERGRARSPDISGRRTVELGLLN
jgi:hypothetical protein